VTDLVAFLRARLDECAAKANSWHDLECDIHAHLDTGLLGALATSRMLQEVPGAVCDCGGPARTLREVEAARAVLDLYEEAGHRMDRAMRDADTVAYQEARVEHRTLRRVLLREAAVHQAHPAHLEEWRP